MSAAHPWALWGLALLPVLLVLLLLQRRRRVILVTSTLELWRQVAQQTTVRAPWLRLVGEVLPPLVIAALLILTAAGPRVPGVGAGARLTLLIDRSPSTMATRTSDGLTRLEVLRERARALVRRLPTRQGRATLLLPPATPRVLSRQEALEVLADLQAASREVRVERQLGLLVREASQGGQAWFLGDVAPPGLEALRRAGGGVCLVGGEGSGAGVVGLGVAREDGQVWLAAETLALDTTPRMTLEVDGHPVPAKLAGSGAWRTLRVPLGQVLPAHLRLQVRGEKDDFTADDEVTWTPPVSYLHQGARPLPPELLAALEALGWRATEELQEASCVVGESQESVAALPRLVVPAGPHPLRPGGPLRCGEAAPLALLEAVEGLALRGVGVAGAQPQPGDRVLLSAGEDPLVVERAGAILLLLDPGHAGTLVHDAAGAWPLLISWIGQRLVPTQGGAHGLLCARCSRRAHRGDSLEVEPREPGSPGDRELAPWLLGISLVLLFLSRLPRRR